MYHPAAALRVPHLWATLIDDWQHTIDPASVKKVAKGEIAEPYCYKSEPLYPKDCILCLYGPTIRPGYEVWRWK